MRGDDRPFPTKEEARAGSTWICGWGSVFPCAPSFDTRRRRSALRTAHKISVGTRSSSQGVGVSTTTCVGPW